MKFNRKKLEELTLEKIKEVNDEAGYRKYLEVPEMVEIIATIMEKKIKVFHDNDAELVIRTSPGTCYNVFRINKGNEV